MLLYTISNCKGPGSFIPSLGCRMTDHKLDHDQDKHHDADMTMKRTMTKTMPINTLNPLIGPFCHWGFRKKNSYRSLRNIFCTIWHFYISGGKLRTVVSWYCKKCIVGKFYQKLSWYCKKCDAGEFYHIRIWEPCFARGDCRLIPSLKAIHTITNNVPTNQRL